MNHLNDLVFMAHPVVSFSSSVFELVVFRLLMTCVRLSSRSFVRPSVHHARRPVLQTNPVFMSYRGKFKLVNKPRCSSYLYYS